MQVLPFVTSAVATLIAAFTTSGLNLSSTRYWQTYNTDLITTWRINFNEFDRVCLTSSDYLKTGPTLQFKIWKQSLYPLFIIHFQRCPYALFKVLNRPLVIRIPFWRLLLDNIIFLFNQEPALSRHLPWLKNSTLTSTSHSHWLRVVRAVLFAVNIFKYRQFVIIKFVKVIILKHFAVIQINYP